jgi:hypothetical protein
MEKEGVRVWEDPNPGQGRPTRVLRGADIAEPSPQVSPEGDGSGTLKRLRNPEREGERETEGDGEIKREGGKEREGEGRLRRRG